MCITHIITQNYFGFDYIFNLIGFLKREFKTQFVVESL